MTRDARIDVADQWYHVIARGQRRDTLFCDGRDKAQYLSILNSTFERNLANMAAYCLMTNHVHLLIYRRGRSLGAIFRQAHMAYAIYFNQRHRKTGYVFQGRFKSYLVLSDRYLAAVVRYIHMNPVSAGMVKTADKYTWSSDRFYRGDDGNSSINLISAPGFEGKRGIRSYGELCESEQEISIPRFGQFVGEVGEEKDLDRRKRGRNRWKPVDRRGRVSINERISELLTGMKLSLVQLAQRTKVRNLSRARQVLMSKLYEEGYPPSEIATCFKRTSTAVVYAHARSSEIKC